MRLSLVSGKSRKDKITGCLDCADGSTRWSVLKEMKHARKEWAKTTPTLAVGSHGVAKKKTLLSNSVLQLNKKNNARYWNKRYMRVLPRCVAYKQLNVCLQSLANTLIDLQM